MLVSLTFSTGEWSKHSPVFYALTGCKKLTILGAVQWLGMIRNEGGTAKWGYRKYLGQSGMYRIASVPILCEVPQLALYRLIRIASNLWFSPN
jgi:hypothetical protein